MKRATRPRIALLAAIGSLGLATISMQGQSATPPVGEWRSYGATPASNRYWPLDQIDAGNFGKLELAWRFRTDNLGPRPEYQFESTPLMANGVLYSTAGSRRAVVAIDPNTGEMLWMHSEQEGQRGAIAPRQLSGRGLAYWTDGREERIIYTTPGYRLIALNAKTGAPVPGFGKNGAVDLKLENDQLIEPLNDEIGVQSAPLVARNVIVIGAAHKTGANPKSKRNIKGYIRGYDARTGKRLWIFHTIPQPGEFGNDTWEKDSWSYTGNTGAWGQISADEELGLAYLPIEIPTGDFYGGDRPGAGLFGESIVAVDLQTGKRKWHFQMVHHGIWDMDAACPPILVDVTMNGRTIKALAQPSKQAFLYVFNRETGEPIWPIEERPVPKGDVPGEWYSPTQPFPTKPPAYDHQSVSVDDLLDFTPELRAEAIELTRKYKFGPMFNPPVVSKAEGPIGALTSGSGSAVATNWPGGSYDPETHIVYVSSASSIGSLGLLPPPAGFSDIAYIVGSALTGPRLAPASSGPGGSRMAPAAGGPPPAAAEGGGGGGLNVRGLPLVKPPYGRISAIDMNKGDILWRVAHGETPDNIKNNPALKGLNIPRTGQPGSVGTLVTRTLVVAGESRVTMTATGQRGAMLRAYNKATGKEEGAVYLPAQQSGSPMTYMSNGKQYIVIAVGGGNYSGELLAFRLPG